MSSLTFYEIRTKKSEITEEGTRQISLACEDHVDAFCFLWVGIDEDLKHVQLLIEEHVLEWNTEQGVRCSTTNRMMKNENRIGIRKGSRFLSAEHDPELLKRIIEKLAYRQFPIEWDEKIRSVFSS